MILCSKNGFIHYEVHPNAKHSVPLWNWENSMSVVNLTRFISWNRDLFWYPQSYLVYARVQVCIRVYACVYVCAGPRLLTPGWTTASITRLEVSKPGATAKKTLPWPCRHIPPAPCWQCPGSSTPGSEFPGFDTSASSSAPPKCWRCGSTSG